LVCLGPLPHLRHTFPLAEWDFFWLLWLVACGLRLVACGFLWLVASCGLWLVASCGFFRLVCVCVCGEDFCALSVARLKASFSSFNSGDHLCVGNGDLQAVLREVLHGAVRRPLCGDSQVGVCRPGRKHPRPPGDFHLHDRLPAAQHGPPPQQAQTLLHYQDRLPYRSPIFFSLAPTLCPDDRFFRYIFPVPK